MQSKRVLEKIKQTKNVTQQIRLIINQISPDNSEKKFVELRKIMFGNIKTSYEDGYDPEVDKLTEHLNEENMMEVVNAIFRNA